MSKVEDHIQELKTVLEHVKSAKDLTVQDTKDLFANLLSIGFFSDNDELKTQMCANAALLLSTYAQCQDFKVHVDTNKTDHSDFNVNIQALKSNN